MALPPILQRYFIVLGQYSWVPFLTLVLGSAAGGFMAVTQAPLSQSYRYRGILVTTTPPAVFSATGAQIQAEGQIFSPEVLLAENVVNFVAAELQEEPPILQKAVKVIIGTADEGSKQPPGTILVQYTNDKEDQSEKGITLLLDAMREQSRLINVSRLRSQIEAIQTRLPAVEEDLRNAEQNLEAYNRREEVNILAAETGTLVGAITGSQQQQRQLRLALEGVEAQIDSLEKRLGLSVDQAYLSSALSADPIISSLRQQIYDTESQLALLQRDLRPEHPSVIELQNRRAAFHNLLEQRAQEVIGGGGVAAPLLQNGRALDIRQESTLDPTRQQLANTLVSLQTEQETIARQLAAAIRTEQQLRAEYATIPNKQLEQTRLAQEVGLKKALYDKIQAALLDAQAAEAETGSSLEIAQFAELDKVLEEVPISKVVLLGGGAVGGLGLGGGLIFLLSMLSSKFMTPSELEAALTEEEAPLLASLPILELERVLLPTIAPALVPLPEENDRLPLLLRSYPPYLESYEKLRSNLRRLGDPGQPHRGAKVIVVTSPGEGEGKTTVAYNLAIASAQSGKRSLLIEGDLRQASVASQVGIHLGSGDSSNGYQNPYQMDPLNYYGNSGECIHPVASILNLYVIPNPGIQRQPATILETSEFRRLLKDCRGRFDFIVIDSPNLSRYNDALLLESFSDGILMVLRPRQTQKELLKQSLSLLADAQIPFLGAVINAAFNVTGNDLSTGEDAEDRRSDEELLATTLY